MENSKKILLSIIFGLVSFSVFVIFTINNSIKESEAFLKDMIINEANSYFNNIINTRKWNALHDGVYVKQKGDLKPNKYLKDNHLYTKDDELLIKINPAWMTRQISEIANQSNKHYFKITSLKPINPINAPDEFEKRALTYFEQNKNKESYTEISNDLSNFDFMGSLKVTKSCLNCHQQQGYQIGDIRGGIRISIPTTSYYESFEKLEDKASMLSFIILSATLILIAAFIYFQNRLNRNHTQIQRSFKDIKELEKQKENMLSRYEYAVEGTRDGLWDWNLNTDEVYFSKNWKKMLGYKEHEINNSLDEWEKIIHPDDKESAIKDITDNQNKITKYYQNIHRLRHKDGRWIWILDRGKTYFDKDGKAYRMVGFHSDITELKNLEVRLKETKQELMEFKFIIESAPISILITDIDANILYVNPYFSKVTGYTKKEVLGQNPRILKFDKSETGKLKHEELWETILRKNTWGGIFKNKKKDGSAYWETATIFPIIDSNGEIINFLGIMREITKEVFLEKQLKEKDEMMLAQSKNAAMGEMISMIAHQWRQPITTISMNANNIIADIDLEEFDEKVIKEVAQSISEQTQYLSKTIDDFRNFFKEDKEIISFKIDELVREINSILLASLKNYNIDFIVNFDESTVLKTYKSELLQVMLNLVKNAKEAITQNEIKNGFIKVDVIENDSIVEISVLDNAGGIEEENMNKVFNAYFTTKDEFNGTGLGLYMSKMIVERNLKGSIDVYNKEGGAFFTISIKKDVAS